MDSDLWLPLVTTALGGVLAIGGGVVGGLLSERGADARDQRAREHEQEVWARGLRYEAHVAFLSIVDDKFRILSDIEDQYDGRSSPDPPEDFLVPVWDRYQALRMVCSEDTAVEAEKAYEAMQAYAFGSGTWQIVEAKRDAYLAAIRREFHLPPIPPLPPPPPDVVLTLPDDEF